MSSLYIVATPIGNLADITERAAAVLRETDRVVAEDTRVSGRLLSALGVSAALSAYHDHNKERVTPGLIHELKGGTSIALITDAGTPGIADPAFYLVRAAVEAGIPVVPIPGPCALVAALVCSGLPTDRFAFENFAPVKPNKRRKFLAGFAGEKRTVIFYESPHRIVRLLHDMADVLGDIRVVIARELTKQHEEFLRGTPHELLRDFEQRAPRGEMVVLFNPKIRGN
jgi:16S rRNA (cytidine1402-2'-O)-methyltransferase